MSLSTDLNAALTALKKQRQDFAPGYHFWTDYGARDENTQRQYKRYVYLSGVIERLTAHRAELRSETPK